ncbi:MAG TPA: tRNA (adenosine(37)-N6)-threonylcarbamoyltransferase complex dimerization subunit type 1 TsaB [Solirubrobacteraceae bacterium]|jgi:tRNA threonylcarbamoyladenosine biosynthesis protein TsaB
MNVLGLDTATSASAVALRLSDGTSRELRDDPPSGAHPGHATRLLAMAHELLAEASLSWREVERIAVGVGPGTFTGLRVGVATARGLAQARGIELVGASSLTALAANADGERLAVIDARRGEVFAEFFRDSDAPASERGALAPGDVSSLLAGGGRSFAIGDGAVRYREALERAGIEVPPDDSPLHLVRAGAICELGLQAPRVGSLDAVLPDYRRRPDAELALRGGTRA